MGLLLAALCSYQVAVAGDASRLDIQARFPAGTVLSVEPGAAPFIGEVRVDGVPVAPRDGRWAAPACARGCGVRYRFDLSRAAAAGEAAERVGGLYSAPPQGFLLRPEGAARLSVRVAATAGFAAGLPQRDGAFEIDSQDLPFAAPAIFGTFAGALTLERIPLGARTLQVALAPSPRPRPALLRFIAAQASAVADFFGRLPVDQTLLLVLPERGAGSHGTTLGGGGALVTWHLGDDAPLDQDEWVLVHELVHTGFPDLQERGQHWAEEGLSTYVEPVARARAGLLPEAKVWRDLALGLPQGAPGEAALDRSPTWGSTYWGGALFWLLADLRIRQRTQGRRSLEDALRGLSAAGGTIAVRWPLRRALEVADRATGARVLQELYSEMGERRGAVDLPALLRDLGLASEPPDPKAPLSPLRAAITARR